LLALDREVGHCQWNPKELACLVRWGHPAKADDLREEYGGGIPSMCNWGLRMLHLSREFCKTPLQRSHRDIQAHEFVKAGGQELLLVGEE
jgi:hypothetical protein